MTNNKESAAVPEPEQTDDRRTPSPGAESLTDLIDVLQRQSFTRRGSRPDTRNAARNITASRTTA